MEFKVGHNEIGNYDLVKIVACDAKASLVQPATSSAAAAKKVAAAAADDEEEADADVKPEKK